jgi:hypothetical protein
MYSATEKICSPFIFDTIGGILIHRLLNYTVFCEPKNYETLAIQAQAFAFMRYFYSLNIIISHPIVYKEGLGYLSICAIVLRSSPLTHVCICNGHPGSELCCGHYIGWYFKHDADEPSFGDRLLLLAPAIDNGANLQLKPVQYAVKSIRAISRERWNRFPTFLETVSVSIIKD